MGPIFCQRKKNGIKNAMGGVSDTLRPAGCRMRGALATLIMATSAVADLVELGAPTQLLVEYVPAHAFAGALVKAPRPEALSM